MISIYDEQNKIRTNDLCVDRVNNEFIEKTYKYCINNYFKKVIAYLFLVIEEKAPEMYVNKATKFLKLVN